MRSIEDKGCLNYNSTHEISSSSGTNFEFQKANGANRTPHHRTGLGKPTPSKWDDAQKWLVNLSRGGEKGPPKTTPRNSNADDRRLIAPVPQKEGYSSGEDEEGAIQKKVDCEEPIWRLNKPPSNSIPAVRSICLRDMGTEMTPIASQEPSRSATPIRASSPSGRSPISSGTSTPVRGQHEVQVIQNGPIENRNVVGTRFFTRDVEDTNGNNVPEYKSTEQVQLKKHNPLETRASAWDEAESTKFTARYKREEVKIQAWENHEKRKADMEMRKMEVKAERMKSRAEEKHTNKLAATRRVAEEKRANAEAKLNEKAVKTSEKADYIRRTGRLPSSLSFKMPSMCCSCSNIRR